MLLGVFLALPAAVIGACLALLRAQERPRPFIVITLLASVGAQLLGIAALLIDRQPFAYVIGVAIAYLIAAIAALRLPRRWGVRQRIEACSDRLCGTAFHDPQHDLSVRAGGRRSNRDSGDLRSAQSASTRSRTRSGR